MILKWPFLHESNNIRVQWVPYVQLKSNKILLIEKIELLPTYIITVQEAHKQENYIEEKCVIFHRLEML